jgi:hypothetical protein
MRVVINSCRNHVICQMAASSISLTHSFTPAVPFSKYNFSHLPRVVKASTMLDGSLSPQHGASSGCGWRNGLQLWRVAANILNKQLRKTTRRGPLAWGLVVGLTTLHRK